MKKKTDPAILKLIREHNDRIEHKDKSILDQQKMIYDLEKKIRNQELEYNTRIEVSIEKGFSEKLMEIIRWQINPSTAMYPFDKEIGQKTNRQKEY